MVGNLFCTQACRQQLQARHTVRVVIASVFVVFLFSIVFGQSQSARRPIKIGISSEEHVEVGRITTLKVTLLDANNVPTPTPENIYLSINVHWPTGKIDAFVVPIAQGSSSGEFQVTMKKAGVCQVDVSESHLLAGSTFILGTARATTPAAAPAAEAIKPGAAGRRQLPRMRLLAVPTFRGGGGGGGATVSVQAATQQELESGLVTQVQFFAPNRNVLADDKDSAEIRVFLLRENGLPDPATINLFSSMGSLSPSDLEIPAGRISATVKIASKDTGTAMLQMPSSHPAFMSVGPMPAVHFVHAITGIMCSASPPDISLIDNTQVVVRLVNEQGNPAPSDSGQDVTLTIDNGRGELDKSLLHIPAGQYECRASFAPTTIGAMTISGSTEGLPIEHAAVNVTWPMMQLLFSLLGGLAGGFIAKLRQKHPHWRVLIGVVAGFVLYWAFIFGLLHVLPRTIALNPFSAFALSVLGGWSGTQVFSSLLSQFGLTKKAA